MKMTMTDFKDFLESLTSHITFEYNGMDCGVDPFNKNKFDVWCGDTSRTCGSLDEAMAIPIFGGKTLTDIFPTIPSFDC